MFQIALQSHSIVRQSNQIVVSRRFLFDPRMASIKLITPEQLQDKRSEQCSNPAVGNLVHFDVRNKDELATEGFIPFSYHVPLAYLNERHLPEDKEKCELVFSCKAGGRSAKAAQKALDLGYKNDGGFEAWKSRSFEHAQGFSGQPFVKCFYDQPTGTCQYIVSCEETKDAVIIDPVLDFEQVSMKVTYGNAEKLLAYVKKHSLNVKWILETHAHADHLTASQYLKRKLNGVPQVGIGAGITQVQQTFAKLFSIAHEELKCEGNEFDILFKAHDTFKLGNLEAKVLHVPGHTPDHLCYLIGDSVFAGDSIFMPDSGSARCDFPGGSAHLLFTSIRKTLFSLPDTTRVFIGHDYQPNNRRLMYETSIKEQKSSNKHLKLDVTEQEFIKMREERDKTLGNPKLLFPSLQVNIRAGHFPAARSNLFPDRPLFVYPVELTPETKPDLHG